MDVETCEVRLIEAAWTLQCLPDPDAKYRRPYGCPLPEHATDYGGVQLQKTPTPREITESEEALEWLQGIPLPRERRFMFHAFLTQRGRKKFKIQWPSARHKSGMSISNYSCQILYKSWLGMMAKRNI